MARIDRRVSPNQIPLWTVYELINSQASRLLATPRTAPAARRFWTAVLPRDLRKVMARVILTARSWVRMVVAAQRGTDVRIAVSP
jgi:hypothetical protein